jgi:DeoR/GlpR family transcriptional regulator of sugar metabolism
MFAQERHNAIIKLVREHRRLNFAELQNLVQVSPATLRRDLTELEKSGDILRVHGGVLDPSYVRSEISFDERVLRHHAAKKAIAACVAPMIPPGSSVFVDAGSTCLEAGKALLGRQDLRILTHSVALMALALHGQAELLCIGGELRRLGGALVGGPALGVLSRIHADFALIGASGIDLTGCSTTELSEAEMKSAILARCTRTILLADASKWQKPSTVQFAPWKAFDVWVTDKKLAAADHKALRSQGVDVQIAT